MENGRDAHNIVVEEKEDAVVADAKTECSGQRSMERSDVAAAGAGMVKNDLEDSEGGSVNLADIGASCVLPIDAVGQRHYRLGGKSAMVSPKSARTSSMGTPWPPLSK